jgi:hypothetical protein
MSCVCFGRRLNYMIEKNQDISWSAPFSKIFESELSQRIANQGMNIMGLYGQLEQGSKYAQIKRSY